MFSDTEDYQSTFKLIEKDRLVQYHGDIELVFIELPKFNKPESDLVHGLEKWLYFIKNAGSLAYIPETLATLPELSQAFSFANEAGLSMEELDIQFKRRDFIILQRDSIELAESKGIEKGIEKGKLEVAQRLIARGMSVNEAAEIAGLGVERLQGLQPA
jgi:predicted transposase/invertase (TIGR01784 family)